MNIDRLRSSQGNQTDMLMMFQNKEDKLIMPDYFATGHDSFYLPHHSYPDCPHNVASPPFTNWNSGNSKSTNISFSTNTSDASDPEPDEFNYDARGSPTCTNHNMEAMREMIFRIAAMQPINIDPEAVKPSKRRNVRISSDPQSVAARHRRERISERIRILQRLVPGGTKMDTASMLDEAIHYVKFLRRQVQSMEKASHTNGSNAWITLGFGYPMSVPNSHGQADYYMDSSATNFSSKAMSSDQYYQNQMLAPGTDKHSFIKF